MAKALRYIIGILMGILIPWLLTYIFLYLFAGIELSWYLELDGGFGQGLAVIAFESIGFAYSVPIFGYSFVIPLLIWILTGVFCGLITKRVLYAVLAPVIGLIVNLVYFMLWAMMFPAYEIPVELIASMLTPLFQGFSIEMFTTLLLHLCWYSLVLPGAILGGLIGGIVARYRV